MNIHTTKPASSRVRSLPRQCCGDECPSGSRNNYFLGKRLTPAGYELEQEYLIGRRRLLNRAIHGWGVVHGFALAVKDATATDLEAGELRIGEGLALDRLGRELVQAKSATLTLDNLLILDADGKPVRADGRELDSRLSGLKHSEDDCWLLSAHYAEQKIDPVTLKGPCDCKRREWDRTCETIVYSLRWIGCDACCEPYECALRCCCPDSECCTERGPQRKEIARQLVFLKETLESEIEIARSEGRSDAEIEKLRANNEKQVDSLLAKLQELERTLHARGGCACLCEHLSGLEIGADCARLSDIGDCTDADLGNGVALACLKLARDEKCDRWAIGSIHDACGPRRLVKRNDLLFDLISGCDVTRIVETGWWRWHRRDQPPVPFDSFAAALGWDEKQPDYAEYPARDFWVRFSRPVRADTLAADCFAMAVMSDQAEGCWREYYRVPIVAVDTDVFPPEKGDPPDHVRSARIVVSGDWLRDGVRGDGSIFLEGETRVEIEVRGDFIEDCNGQTVDANPRGRSSFPSGSDGPGDSYLSTFTVAQRIRPKPVSRPPAPKGRAPTAT